MTIQWFGLSSFKITTKSADGDIIIVTDPYSNQLGLKKLRLSADIIALTHDHPDLLDYKSIKGSDRTPSPFLIKGHGEYEVSNVFVYGLPSIEPTLPDKQKNLTTLYVFRIENIDLVHLGNIKQKELTPEQLEFIEDADILLIPVGGKNTLNAKEAAGLVSQIEPRIVIPMYYKIPGLKLDIDSVDKFIKEIGNKKEELDKLRILKKDLPQEETKLIILKN